MAKLLAVQAEREGRHKLREEVKLREEQLGAAREEVARQAVTLGELREATSAAVAKQAEAEAAVDASQHERVALQQGRTARPKYVSVIPRTGKT